MKSERSESILNLLCSSNWFIINKILVKKIGLTEALVLGELCSEYEAYKSRDALVDGMFYASVEHLQSETCIGQVNLRNAIKRLEELNIITTAKKGIPPVRHFKINVDVLQEYFEPEETNQPEQPKVPEKPEAPAPTKQTKSADTNMNSKSFKSLAEYCNSWTQNKGLQDALYNWLELMYANKKILTLSSLTERLIELKSRCSNDEEMISVVKETADRLWLSFKYVLDNRDRAKAQPVFKSKQLDTLHLSNKTLVSPEQQNLFANEPKRSRETIHEWNAWYWALSEDDRAEYNRRRRDYERNQQQQLGESF